eukprot:7092839-Prorocentrum_lima.AAC.1
MPTTNSLPTTLRACKARSLLARLGHMGHAPGRLRRTMEGSLPVGECLLSRVGLSLSLIHI